MHELSKVDNAKDIAQWKRLIKMIKSMAMPNPRARRWVACAQ